MKDVFKNPNLYYILAPSLAGVWALLAGVIFYPGSVKAYEDQVKPEYEQSQGLIKEILTIQPQRLQYQVESSSDRTFDFGQVVTALTQEFKIPTTRYTLIVRGEVNKGGKQARSATMEVQDINMVRLARFLSTMLTAWPNLECEKLNLEKAKTGKDNWDADMTLTYYY